MFVLLPLDERPCNFIVKIFNGEKVYDHSPGASLSQKKTPASYDHPRFPAHSVIEKADAAVISIDTLLYGGLIPRALHLSEETVLERLMLLKELREKNPQVKLYAFQCIMRCPKYSSDDEEPDYYELYGKEIHHIRPSDAPEKLGMGDADELSELKPRVDPRRLRLSPTAARLTATSISARSTL